MKYWWHLSAMSRRDCMSRHHRIPNGFRRQIQPKQLDRRSRSDLQRRTRSRSHRGGHICRHVCGCVVSITDIGHIWTQTSTHYRAVIIVDRRALDILFSYLEKYAFIYILIFILLINLLSLLLNINKKC